MKEGATEVLACKHTYRGSRCIPRHPWVSFAGPAPDTCAMLRGCRGAVGPNKHAAQACCTARDWWYRMHQQAPARSSPQAPSLLRPARTAADA